MRTQFPLFQGHLDLAHSAWNQIIEPGDTVIDATCGNGHDLLALMEMGASHAFAFDIQKEAIENSKQRCHEHLQKITWINECHTHLPEQEVKLIVYNLGYLPGADKSITTQEETSLASIRRGVSLVAPGGGVSITLYPGHPAGRLECARILSWVATLCPRRFSVVHHRWANRRSAPEWLLITRGVGRRSDGD